VEPVATSLQMWVTLGLVGAALALYIAERVPSEVVSIGLLAVMLAFFHFFPVPGADGTNLLGAERLLAGFGNPALITVMALLVASEGMVRTGALDRVARWVIHLRLPPAGAVWLTLLIVVGISGFVNDTPVVVIFIPILRAIAGHLRYPLGRVMMPLSFAALLGGTTTLIGTSTNLLASGVLIQLGLPAFDMFEFTFFGAAFALVGLLYMALFAGRLLPDRTTLAEQLSGAGHQFISHLTVGEGSPLVGQGAVAGAFPGLPDVTVKLVQRASHVELPPFDGLHIRAGDVLVVAATRKALTEAAARHPGLLAPAEAIGDGRDDHQVLAEVMLPPSSRLIGRTLEQLNFRPRPGWVAAGVRRRASMVRAHLSAVRLQVGDELLVIGPADDEKGLAADRDLVAISGSAAALMRPHHAKRAILIFVAAVLLAAFGVVPIVVTSVAAAAAMVVVGALNVRQAVRALRGRIFFLAAAVLALGSAMEYTGAATWLARGLVSLLAGAETPVILSAFFLLVAAATNAIGNNASALLFTPVAISLAKGLGVDPHVFAVAAVLAANCSFATPVGYQTNLLVMGPGNYTFRDYVRFGGPLVLIVWALFSLLAPWYYGL
jgi:di/tricarboxylate transporter